MGALLVATGNAPLRAQNAEMQKQLATEWKAGEKALQGEQFGSAIAHFDRVLQILQRGDVAVEANTLSAAFHNRADAHYNLEQWQAARADYSRVIELTPSDADAYAMRAITRKTSGDYDGLISDAQSAASLDSQYQSLLDDARSTVLFRRAMLGFLLLGALVLTIGAIPFGRALIKLLQAG